MSRRKSALTESFFDGGIKLTIDGKSYLMKRVSSASGEKYQAYDNPKTIFWSKGNDAYITINGKILPDVFTIVCREPMNSREDAQNGTYSRGTFKVDVEKTGIGKLSLTVDGETFKMERVFSADGARYVDEGRSDTVFWFYVNGGVLTVRGSEYAMGQMLKLEKKKGVSPKEDDLSELLTAGTWNVESIEGKKLVKGSRITMDFDEEGVLKGFASVNSFTTSWLAAGNRIIIGRPSHTRKAGIVAMIDQERHFLKALDSVCYYKIEGRTLTLITKEAKEIIAKY